ncbi:MAG TPA: hypothetical protein VGQ56_07710 [Gemmatimonadaceae bacterium]|nr:hypothetical protein [Gemmatimonadaceae bacterium]
MRAEENGVVITYLQLTGATTFWQCDETVLVLVLVAGAGCWCWLLVLVAGAGCRCWLPVLVAPFAVASDQ